MAYARIDEGFWTDPKIRGLSLEGKIIAAWLFTNPHRHFSGLYYLPIVLIPVEIGVTIGVSKLELNILEELHFIKYSHEFSVVWVINMLKHQSGDKRLSPQQVVGIQKQLSSLHGCPLIKDFIIKYQTLGVFYDGKIDTPTDTPTDTKSQSQSKSKKEEPPLPPKGVCNGFDSFWLAYPKKIGKGAALKKYEGLRRQGRLPPISDLIAAIENQKTWEQWQKDEGQYIPNPATWLNQGRWEDQPPEGGPQWIRELSRPQSTS